MDIYFLLLVFFAFRFWRSLLLKIIQGDTAEGAANTYFYFIFCYMINDDLS